MQKWTRLSEKNNKKTLNMAATKELSPWKPVGDVTVGTFIFYTLYDLNIRESFAKTATDF